MVDMDAEKKYFSEALCLFHEMQWLHNVPVTEILTRGSLDAIPEEWMEQLEILSNKELNDFVLGETMKTEWPDSLKAYVNRCKELNKLPLVPALPPLELPRNFKTGLSQKKQHEIVHLADLVHEQCASRNIQTIIDLGAGLGYVCQMLHHLYGYRVLGFEANEENVSKARARQREFYPESLTRVKYVHCKVTCDSTDVIESILQREFPDILADTCLIGLHACGDLGTSATRIFCNIKSIRLFILISCCYHKLSVSKSVRAPLLQERQYFHNFPTSDCMREAIASHDFDTGQFLRVPFLRLACQESADKWHGMTEEKHAEHAFHVLARAVLELYARQNNLLLKKRVRKATRKSQCSNFQTYLKDSFARYDLVPDTDAKLIAGTMIARDELEESIIQLWEKENGRLKAAEIYTGLQMMLQLPAESLILQDRLCWLRQQGFKATIVPVTNKCVSPRSYAIVSHKQG